MKAGAHVQLLYLKGNSLLPLEGELGMELDRLPFFMLPADPGRINSSTTVHCTDNNKKPTRIIEW